MYNPQRYFCIVEMGTLCSAVPAVHRAAMFQMPDEIYTKRLFVEDPEGRVCAELGMFRYDQWVDVVGPSLVMYDNSGVDRLIVGATPYGMGHTAKDAEGNMRYELTVWKDKAGLGLMDETYKQAAGLMVTSEWSSVELSDKSGEPRAGLLWSDDGPSLELFDKTGRRRVLLGAGNSAAPDEAETIQAESTLLLSGPDGEVLWRAPSAQGEK